MEKKKKIEADSVPLVEATRSRVLATESYADFTDPCSVLCPCLRRKWADKNSCDLKLHLFHVILKKRVIYRL